MVHPKADIPVEFFDAQADYRRYVSDSLRKGKATIGSLPGVIVKSLQETEDRQLALAAFRQLRV